MISVGEWYGLSETGDAGVTSQITHGVLWPTHHRRRDHFIDYHIGAVGIPMRGTDGMGEMTKVGTISMASQLELNDVVMGGQRKAIATWEICCHLKDLFGNRAWLLLLKTIT